MVTLLPLTKATKTMIVDLYAVEAHVENGFRLEGLVEQESWTLRGLVWSATENKNVDDPPRLQKHVMAILSFTEDDPVARLQAQNESLRASLNQAKEALEAEVDKTEKAEARAKERQEAVSRLGRSLDEARADAAQERERAQRYERDIAKVRTAVGEIRMKEILAGGGSR